MHFIIHHMVSLFDAWCTRRRRIFYLYTSDEYGGARFARFFVFFFEFVSFEIIKKKNPTRTNRTPEWRRKKKRIIKNKNNNYILCVCVLYSDARERAHAPFLPNNVCAATIAYRYINERARGRRVCVWLHSAAQGVCALLPLVQTHH